MIWFVPFAVPIVFNLRSLKVSGVASFADDFCTSLAVVSNTAHSSARPPEGEISPVIERWLGRHGSFLTYLESRAQMSAAIGEADCSSCSPFHLSPIFAPSGGSVQPTAKRATHSCQICCCSGRNASRPLIFSVEPSGKIVNSNNLIVGSMCCCWGFVCLSADLFPPVPESRVRN